MARAQKAYRIDTKNKKVIIYNGMERTEEDKEIIEMYMKIGYIVKKEDKKSVSVAQMRKELKKDPETLNAFNEAYTSDEVIDNRIGYHRALKIYSDWKKEQKNQQKEKEEVKKEDKE